MRHGGVGPHQTRSERDLGRFGLGMKTASLSQCRRLTVISRRDGVTSGARWDLDLVAERQNWVVQVLDAEDVVDLPHVRDLERQRRERSCYGSSSIAHSRARRSRTWRLGGSSTRREITSPWPSTASCPATMAGQRSPSRSTTNRCRSSTRFSRARRRRGNCLPTALTIDGSVVEFRPFILPHITKLSRDDLALAGGEEGLRRHQGFYVYRARRLITFGTWFRLLRQGELTKLARVQVDIPNTLDHLWALDVKKSTAFPPEAVRAGLLRTIERIGGESRNVFTHRGERVNRTDVQQMWRRVDVRGGFNYEITRDHPIILDTAARLDKGGGGRIEPLLRAIEMALPVDSIYADMASDRVVQPAPDANEAEAALYDLASRLSTPWPPCRKRGSTSWMAACSRSTSSRAIPKPPRK